jgi:NAD(P)-dependent dehydrogenase (short-subunit alcohol dehydrogenase family)
VSASERNILLLLASLHVLTPYSLQQIKAANPSASVSFLKLDLSSFESIHTAARKFAGESQRLDILMNNAGVMALDPGLSEEGYEIQFGINHVGHALLTKLLMPVLLKTAEGPNSDVRVLFLTSAGHMLAPSAGIIFKDLKTTQPTITSQASWGRYGQSKLAKYGESGSQNFLFWTVS